MDDIYNVIGGDGREKVKYAHSAVTGTEKTPNIGWELSIPTVQHTEEGEPEKIYKIGFHPEILPTPTIGKINIIINEAIKLANQTLEAYEFEIERINTFSLFEERIKSLWEYRGETNDNFNNVVVHLMAAVKNSHYQKYNKKQYNSLKLVLEKIKNVSITKNQVKESLKLLKDNNIDIYAPIRNWGKYIVEVKERE